MGSAQQADPVAAEKRRALRFGWCWLLLWAAFGSVLEVMHGFKIGECFVNRND